MGRFVEGGEGEGLGEEHMNTSHSHENLGKILSAEEYIKNLEKVFHEYIAVGPRPYDLQYFQEHFGTPERVLYPCSNVDTNPSLVFENVYYIDQDEGAMKLLQSKGYTTQVGDISNFTPNFSFDLLYLQNPQLSDENINRLLDFLVPGGYVVCNNYHLTADQIARDKRFKFIIEPETGKTSFEKMKEEDFSSSAFFPTRYMGNCIFQKKK